MSNLSATDKALVTNLFGVAEFEVDALLANIRRIFGSGDAAAVDPDAISKAVDAAVGTKLSDLSDRLTKLEQAPSDAADVAEIRTELDALKADHDKQAAAFKALASGSDTSAGTGATGNTGGPSDPAPGSSTASAIDKIDPAPTGDAPKPIPDSTGTIAGTSATTDQPDPSKAAL